MSKKTAALIATMVFLSGSSGTVANYTSTKITDSNLLSGYRLTDPSFVAINNSGTVVFRASSVDARGVPTGDVILTGSGGQLKKIADSLWTFFRLAPGGINSNGVVAFQATSKDFSTGIYSGGGGPLTTIARSGDIGLLLEPPDITDDGSVAFNSTDSKLRLFLNGVTRVVDPDGLYSGLTLNQLNRKGAVLFFGLFKGQGVLATETNGQISNVPIDFTKYQSGVSVAFNDSGNIAFSSVTRTIPVQGVVVKFDGSQTTTIATGVLNARVPNINNSDTRLRLVKPTREAAHSPASIPDPIAPPTR